MEFKLGDRVVVDITGTDLSTLPDHVVPGTILSLASGNALVDLGEDFVSALGGRIRLVNRYRIGRMSLLDLVAEAAL